MNLVKVLTTALNSLNQRAIKVLRFGVSDVQTSLEASPYGVDSNPIEGMVAIYSPTTDKGGSTIIGYINKNQKAGVGEFRTFATDADGVEKFYTWMKADGTMEIGGVADNAIRFSPLETATDTLATDINAQLTAIATAISSLGGSYTPSPISIDISGAKIDEIKTL